MEVLERVQASDSEVREYLKKIYAFEYRGYWRIFDEEYRVEALKNVMYALMKHNWEVVTVRLVSQEIPEIPYEVLAALLRTIGDLEQEVFTPNRLQIYQMCAIDLFISNQEYFAEEFVTAFKKVTELTIYRRYLSNFKLEDILQGIAIQRTNKHRATIKYLPRYQMTYNFEDRLQTLFSLKEKWSEGELGVYLSDVSALSMPQLLLKYTKKVIEGNSVMYTGKLN